MHRKVIIWTQETVNGIQEYIFYLKTTSDKGLKSQKWAGVLVQMIHCLCGKHEGLTPVSRNYEKIVGVGESDFLKTVGAEADKFL